MIPHLRGLIGGADLTREDHASGDASPEGFDGQEEDQGWSTPWVQTPSSPPKPGPSALIGSDID